MNNRLLLYVHFNQDNQLSEHVIYQLRQLRSIFSEIFFISNSELTKNNQKHLEEKGLIDGFMQRENKGYDFAAWSDGMKYLGFDRLLNYDSVTIMNDTCFGPIFDLKAPLEAFEEDENTDFWGITNNRSHKITKPWDGQEFIIPDHIQSYFVSYKQRLVKSQAFTDFWSNIEVLDDVVKVIVKYETAMTKHFEEAGFKSGVMFDTRKEDWTGMAIHDFSVFNLPALVKRRLPFLKIKAFSYCSESLSTPLVADLLKSESHYPFSLIVNHMTWMDYPEREYMLADKSLYFPAREAEKKTSLKIGIHFHLTSLALFSDFIDNFEKYIQNYELYLSVSTPDLKAMIKSKYDLPKIKKVLVTGNQEKDGFAWQAVAKEMAGYDLIGHFHNQKFSDGEWIVEQSQRQDLVNELLVPAQEIFHEFEKNLKLGLVIPDLPSYFQHFYDVRYFGEDFAWEGMKALWQKIEFLGTRPKELKAKDTYVMPYGNMLWYRPEALRSLLELETSEEDFADLGFSHAFERLPIYVSWANGYDFRISQSQATRSAAFTANYAAKRLLRENTPDFSQLRFRQMLKILLRKMKEMARR